MRKITLLFTIITIIYFKGFGQNDCEVVNAVLLYKNSGLPNYIEVDTTFIIKDSVVIYSDNPKFKKVYGNYEFDFYLDTNKLKLSKVDFIGRKQ